MSIQNLKYMAEAFKESANNDLQIIEILYEKGNDNILIFYHLQQALEKILKAAVIENSSKIQTYGSIKNTISHNLEKSSFELIDELCNYYIQIFQKMEKSHEGEYDKLVKQITSTKDNIKSEFNNVKENWIKNIKDYDSFINNIYIKFMKCKEQIKTYKEYKIPILSLGLLLSMALYKMDVVSRYPEKDFDYKNIGFLKNNLNSIYKILCMFKFWLSLVNE